MTVMTQATTRNIRLSPARRAAVAQALDAYLLGTGSADERDIALEAALLAEGVLSADDTVESLQVVQDGPEIQGVRVLAEAYKATRLTDTWVPFVLSIDRSGRTVRHPVA
jgi:hypothetical protein